MFMFRRRRNGLIKRLLKARVRRPGAGASATGTGCGQYDGGVGEERIGGTTTEGASMVPEYEALVRGALLKKLEEPQLELLAGAVESGGADLSDCVLVPRVDPALTPPPHLLCCQMWRWPDLRHATQLKRLPVCEAATDPIYTCCNPYHWSRLCEPESPPPPYSRFAADQLKPEDRAPSEIQIIYGDRYPGSLTTSGEGSTLGGTGEWCRLAYWELTQRVGNQFPVRVPAIAVFEDEPRGTGLCLATLQHNFTPPESVRKTRAKIGHGVILSLEEDGIWAYNISGAPIFINSPTLTADLCYSGGGTFPSLCVYRVPPGHCLCIHDPGRVPAVHRWVQHQLAEHQHPPTGPIDPNSIRISFAKGWGPNYSRQEITACPCWLEILLAPCR